MARLLLLQLLALAAVSLLLAASPAPVRAMPTPHLLAASPVHAAPPSPLLDTSPVHATPPSSDLTASSVHYATLPYPDVPAAVAPAVPRAAVFRRLGPPRLLLSDNPDDAAAPSSSGAHAAADQSLWPFLVSVVFAPLIVIAVFGILKGVACAAVFITDFYSATSRSMREARNRAVRVRPLDQDALAAAAGQ